MPPDFIIAGNVSRDLVPDGWLPGGTAVYAAAVARGLGRRVGVVTAATADVVAAGLPGDVEVARHPAATSVSMANTYTDGRRRQRLAAAGEPIPPALVPVEWETSRIVLIGPVFQEASAALAARFRGLVGICAQGFLRVAAPCAPIRPLPAADWDAAPVLCHAQALFLSEEDLGPDGEAALAAWTEMVPLIAVTNGRNGSRIFTEGEWRHIPAVPAREVDPTGAGDAFATGFLVALDEGAAPWQAARFGAATASLVVEGVGPVVTPRAAVAARLQRA